MDSKLQNRIYKAQCFGNVEPIEFMVPYPNIFSLVEGENIKFASFPLYKDLNINNNIFLNLCNQASYWLTELGVKPQSYVFLPNVPFPYREIILYGIWNLGAIVVISNTGEIPVEPTLNFKNIISKDFNFENEFFNKNKKFNPQFRPNLMDEAMIYFNNNNAFKYSHYNLLVNANGIQKKIKLNRGESVKINIPNTSISWVILQAILPLLTGTSLTYKNPKYLFSLPEQFENPNYIIREKWVNIDSTIPPTIFILPENSGALSINKEPIHLTDYKFNNNKLELIGHSVMMGYLDKAKNDKCFFNQVLTIS